jgi:hypothetical protein
MRSVRAVVAPSAAEQPSWAVQISRESGSPVAGLPLAPASALGCFPPAGRTSDETHAGPQGNIEIGFTFCANQATFSCASPYVIFLALQTNPLLHGIYVALETPKNANNHDRRHHSPRGACPDHA